MQIKLSAASLFFLLLPYSLQAEDILSQRIRQIQQGIAHHSPISANLFSPAFLHAIPLPQIKALLQKLHQQYGNAVRLLPQTHTPYYGHYLFLFQKNVQIPVKLRISPQPPHKIIGLWFGLPLPYQDSLEKVRKQLQKLPGQVSLCVVEFQGKKAIPLFQIHPQTQLAIGSAFKLYILGCLVDKIQRKQLRWEQVIYLQNALKSHPSGTLHKWPTQSPITLHTLATLMIARSDNTATDHLWNLLGRTSLENQLAKMGHGKPQKNIPFLSTREFFQLKYYPNQQKKTRLFLTLPLEKKKEFLANFLQPTLPTYRLQLDRPKYLDKIGWFASTSDLCRAMQWFYQQRHTSPGQRALQILRINPGLPLSSKSWTYIGYKGGSDLGALNLTYLLQHKNKRWFALSFTWNHPKQNIQSSVAYPLILRLFSLLETKVHKRKTPPPPTKIKPTSKGPQKSAKGKTQHGR